MIKTLPDFNNYKVGSNGIVIGSRGKVLKQERTRDGYRRVTLCQAGRLKRIFVHRLVARLFCPKPKGCDVVNHLNGVKHDNNFKNLEWTTNQGNVEHCVRTGLQKLHCQYNPSAKLSERQVLKIRSLKGVTRSGILAAKYNVSKTTIKDLWKRKTWKQLN